MCDLAEDLDSGPHVEQQALLPAEPPPQSPWTKLSQSKWQATKDPVATEVCLWVRCNYPACTAAGWNLQISCVHLIPALVLFFSHFAAALTHKEGLFRACPTVAGYTY